MANERFINARNRRRGFTTVLNQMLDDPTISLEAKGLLTILLSNKDDWKINMKEIIGRSKNGRDAHYRVIKELINSGYFFRIQIKEKGKFKEVIYVFSDDKEEVKEAVKELEDKGLLPHPENQEADNKKPFPENPDTEKPYPENQYNNNTNTKKTNTNKTNTSMYVGSDHLQLGDEEQTKPLQMYIIDRFASVYKLTGYAKKNLLELIETHGETLVSEALERTICSETGKPIAYIKGILKKWSAAGVKTADDIAQYEETFRRNQQKMKKRSTKLSRHQDKPSGSSLPQSLKEALSAQTKTGSTVNKDQQAQIRARLAILNAQS